MCSKLVFRMVMEMVELAWSQGPQPRPHRPRIRLQPQQTGRMWVGAEPCWGYQQPRWLSPIAFTRDNQSQIKPAMEMLAIDGERPRNWWQRTIRKERKKMPPRPGFPRPARSVSSSSAPGCHSQNGEGEGKEKKPWKIPPFPKEIWSFSKIPLLNRKGWIYAFWWPILGFSYHHLELLLQSVMRPVIYF